MRCDLQIFSKGFISIKKEKKGEILS